MSPDVEEFIAKLTDPKSAKRRSAAKRLRKLKDPDAGPALRLVLEHEVRDRRTWETQYQMIMALAECGDREALPLLWSLLERPLEPMVFTAIGDALVRLGHEGADDRTVVTKLLSTHSASMAETARSLCNGVLRAVAMLRLQLDDLTIAAILRYGASAEGQNSRFWIAAAAPGWDGAAVTAFLQSCAGDRLEDTRKAAEAALRKQYLKWDPL